MTFAVPSNIDERPIAIDGAGTPVTEEAQVSEDVRMEHLGAEGERPGGGV